MSTPAFDPVIAATRFGVGLSPSASPDRSVAEMLARLSGPDLAAQRLPLPGLDTVAPTHRAFLEASRRDRTSRGTEEEEAARQAYRALRREIEAEARRQHLTVLARAATSADGLRERLVAFLADHFTVKPANYAYRHLVVPYIEDAIRPHVAGRFADMAIAATLHPVMMSYLDQTDSIGPNSATGERTGRGLNENLARELLELHLLGVDAGYSQTDVTELAELLTGLRYDGRNGFSYDAKRAEPGAEVVLGRRYSAEADLDTVTAAIRDLCRAPQVAAHVARKLAVHFVSPEPPEDLVSAIATAFRDSDGDLARTTAALLEHPAAWSPTRAKVRRPDLYVAAALRALDVSAEAIVGVSRKAYVEWLRQPLTLMGQPWLNPTGPDGWSESPADWITPQGLAGRITWAMGAPSALIGDLPDPRGFVTAALGPEAPPDVTFAAAAAEARADGIGVVLASPAFQRI